LVRRKAIGKKWGWIHLALRLTQITGLAEMSLTESSKAWGAGFDY